jgi:hypothetical protein
LRACAIPGMTRVYLLYIFLKVLNIWDKVVFNILIYLTSCELFLWFFCYIKLQYLTLQLNIKSLVKVNTLCLFLVNVTITIC